MYRQLGVSIYEVDLPWAEVAPTRPRDLTSLSDPAYIWPNAIQQAVTQARRFRMRMLLRIVGAPAWANGGHASNWAPRHPVDFAAFAAAASRRYPSVHLWMIWGEPNRAASFEPLVPAQPIGNLDRAQRAAPHRYRHPARQQRRAADAVRRAQAFVRSFRARVASPAGAHAASPTPWPGHRALLTEDERHQRRYTSDD